VDRDQAHDDNAEHDRRLSANDAVARQARSRAIGQL
jgi:hypothetical protein